MKTILIITALLYYSITAVAQDDSFIDPFEKSIENGYNISIGGQFASLSDLNSILVAEGIPKISPIFITVGGGLNLVFRNHFIHFKGNASLNSPKDDINNIRTISWGFGGGFSYGYRFNLGPIFGVPYVGIVNDGLFVEIQDLQTSNTNIITQIQFQIA